MPDHGDDLSEATRRLLRDPPPAPTLRWVAEAVAGAGATASSVRALTGGISSAVHAVGVRRAGGGGPERVVVVRRFVRRPWIDDEPDLPRREAAALRLAAGIAVPTPEVLGVDADPAACDAPAVVMSLLPGRHEWHPSDPDAWVDGLARLLPAVHAATVPTGLLPPYRPYPLEATRPPAWTARPGLWERAVRLVAGGPPAVAGVASLVHRDFHPGNVLWEQARGGDPQVSGLVDWVNASAGDPQADVGHGRRNLRAVDPALPDRFLRRWAAHAGRRVGDYDPWWDLASLLGGLDDESLDGLSPADEDWVASAVADHGHP